MATCTWNRVGVHPSLYFKVLLSGEGKTWLEIRREIRDLIKLVDQLSQAGAKICDRDGAHVFYDVPPGKRDPLG